MGELSSAERARLPRSAFVFPDKAPGPDSYPIPDEAHARDALSRVDEDGDEAEQAAVRKAVRERFPSMDVAG